MKLLKYKEIVGKSKEKLDELMAPIRSLRMKKKAESMQLSIDEKLFELESKVQNICVEKEIDFDALLDALDEIDLLERRKNQYSKVIEELFSE